ncbi:MAG: archaeosine biosynthesis radical SAM protein RaSEA [Methanobacterium sp.]|nr:archaeosine biosynthesis radical SAM protein RaSEA [Methanobacterium sp.]
MEIQNLMQEIRENALDKMEKRSPEDLAASWSGEDILYSGKGNTIFIVLPTSGCAWAVSVSGGCTMCSYVADSPLEKVDSEELIDIFKKSIGKYEIKEKTVVKIFVSGSFLNPNEIPVRARNEILKILKNKENIEEVVVESRPEYITAEVLKECCKFLGNKIFEIGIGLETSNDYTREEKINKGFSREDFERALEIIKTTNLDCDVKAKAYLFVKPILTSEKNAIDEAVKSAEYAESVGVSRISFCPATIHKDTLMELLWKGGSYQPPWIWSIMEIIKQVRKSLDIPVIMDTAGFGSRRGPYNCKKCNSLLKNMIIDSNLNQTIPEDFECECKDKWRSEIEYGDITRSTTNLIRKK